MAGYIGSKASVTQVDGYNRSEADAEFVNDPNDVITVSGSNVGIGTSSPAAKLTVSSVSAISGTTVPTTPSSYNFSIIGTNLNTTGNYISGLSFEEANATRAAVLAYDAGGSADSGLAFATQGSGTISERMRIDSSGNLLVGKTSTSFSTAGFRASPSGTIQPVVDGGSTANFNRLTSDGDIVDFRKDGTKVGSIGSASGELFLGSGTGSDAFLRFGYSTIVPANGNGANRDNAIDLGSAVSRFDDIYATNGTIQTSDRNEKQDIEALSDAEQRVAVAAKGLLRKYRWKDAVAEKGDAARIHFGIIAQDLQDAFAAEGLDAGRYGMFISSTWWEAQTDVPAVEAVAEVLDEEGNVVTEAVEAKEAYIRTDTYETLEEAPEGATERTRLGVRYPELLAFIIGAM